MSYFIMLPSAVILVWCFFGSEVNGAAYFNDLKITWGRNLSDSKFFRSLPRTEAYANILGWTKINNCTDKASWRGKRYAQLPDYSIVLLFDVNGYIAGIQMGIPKGLPNGFPSTPMKQFFAEDGDHYFSTVYFTDTRSICNSGRSATEFDDFGTASSLALQFIAIDYRWAYELPLYPHYAQHHSFNESGCVPTMGRHYWHNLTNNFDCNDYRPVFLMATNERVNAFGWILTTQVNSSRFEQPVLPAVRMAMPYIPPCFDNVGQITTLHVFLTNDVTLNSCPTPTIAPAPTQTG